LQVQFEKNFENIVASSDEEVTEICLKFEAWQTESKENAQLAAKLDPMWD
jgi:hypothetical protein